mgnify:CR=1 FL=1
MIYTSLNEIKSFKPCVEGWKAILVDQGKTEADDVPFPLTAAVESNSISDVCWLLGKRKKEIQVAVRFACMCADSVAHLNNRSGYAATAAATAAAAAAYDAYDATAAAYAADAAAYAGAGAYAAYADAAAYAAGAAAHAAYADAEQKEKNKQLLILCITEWQGV